MRQPAHGHSEMSVWRAVAAGAAAGLIGIVWLLPPSLLAGEAVGGIAPKGDFAQSLSGAIAFIRDSWRFPLFEVEGLAEGGTANIAFTDSIPLYALLWKIAAGFVELRFEFYVPLWIALSILAQAFATTLALWALNVRSFAFLLLSGLLAILWPIFLYRYNFEHPALAGGQFVVIWALGLTLSKPTQPDDVLRWRFSLHWSLLLTVALTIHPYFLFMAAILLAIRTAMEASLLSGWKNWARLGLRRAAPFLPVLAMLILGGYLENRGGYGDSGYGGFTINLVGFFIPLWTSALIPDWTSPTTSAAIGGYSYLGAGGIVMVVAAALILIVAWRPGRAFAISSIIDKRVPAFLFVVGCFLVTYYAVSGTIHLAGTVIADLPDARLLGQLTSIFRDGSRFFWIVSYAILLLSLCALASARRRGLVLTFLFAIVLLQAIDLRPLTSRFLPLTGTIAADVAWFDLIALTEKPIAVLPAFACGHDPQTLGAQVQLLAARSGATLSNSLVTARPANDCERGSLTNLDALLEEGRLVLVIEESFTPQQRRAGGLDESGCRERLGLVACRTSWSDVPQTLAGAFAPSGSPVHLVGRSIATAADADGEDFLGAGFSTPESWGTWVEGHEGVVRLPIAANSTWPQTMRLEITGLVGNGLPPVSYEITVFAQDAPVGRLVPIASQSGAVGVNHGWEIVDLPLPPLDSIPHRLVIGFQVDNPVSPSTLGNSQDSRILGIGLRSISFY